MFKFHSLLIPKSKEQQALRKEINRTDIDVKILVKGIKQWNKAFEALGKAMAKSINAFAAAGAIKKESEYEDAFQKVKQTSEKANNISDEDIHDVLNYADNIKSGSIEAGRITGINSQEAADALSQFGKLIKKDEEKKKLNRQEAFNNFKKKKHWER